MADLDRSTPLDDAFRAFAHPLRREIICELVEGADEAYTITVLSERLARRLDRATPEQLARNLHHIHLPKLDALGVLEYDRRSGTVRYRGSRAVSTLLDTDLVDC